MPCSTPVGEPAEERWTEKGGERTYRGIETMERRRKLLAVFRVRIVEQVFRGLDTGLRD